MMAFAAAPVAVDEPDGLDLFLAPLLSLMA
jgi:hypothetical protein